MKDVMRIDYIGMKKTIRQTFIILLIMMIAAGYGMSSASSAVAMAAVAGPYFFVVTSFSLDAFNGWDRYRSMLPLTRKDVVGGRYVGQLVLSFSVTIGACLVGVVFQSVGQAMGFIVSESFVESAIEILAAGFMSYALIMIVISLAMPICFKTGLTRAAMILPAIMVVLFIAVPALLGNYFGPIELGSIMNMLTILNSAQGIMFAALLMLIVMAVAYYTSFRVSCRVYAAKDL